MENLRKYVDESIKKQMELLLCKHYGKYWMLTKEEKKEKTMVNLEEGQPSSTLPSLEGTRSALSQANRFQGFGIDGICPFPYPPSPKERLRSVGNMGRLQCITPQLLIVDQCRESFFKKGNSKYSLEFPFYLFN